MSRARVRLQPAWVLHRRRYRDTSFLLDTLTLDHGRVTLVARGVRGGRRGAAANLQPFVPLLLSWTGRADLVTLSASEASAPALRLHGQRLFSGLYLNELLYRLLQRHDTCTEIFAAYGAALEALAGSDAVAPVLRRCEWRILQALGYGFSLTQDGRSGEPLAPSGVYSYDPDYGLVACDATNRGPERFRGAQLLAVAAGDFSGPAAVVARRLMQQALDSHLGGYTLKSRELARQPPRPAPADTAPGG